VNIGIVCYASVGGSGVVATELATALAERGHQVHIISSEVPFRLRDQAGLTFHRVETPTYPLFREPQYLLSLANKIVQVARAQALDIVHAHYAIPHAAAAYLARQIIADSGRPAPAVVTTLHGTDITIVGSDPSYTETVAYCIEQSDAVTAVSESLKTDTYRALGVTRDIEVIPNFLDCARHTRRAPGDLRDQLLQGAEHLVVHMSNFRPVKRVDAVIEIFRHIRAEEAKARLLLVGDGPHVHLARERLSTAGLMGSAEFLGEQLDIVSVLSVGDLFLLPSSQESFGLAALEAMACGVPVVASRVGGLPEVIEHGRTGLLYEPDDLEGMAAGGLMLLRDQALHQRIAAAARQQVVDKFCTDVVVPRYEDCYARLLGASARAGSAQTST
jgi:N-acetyl-alpha-D-glucosaminyl L-malate synthase BshA